MITASRVVSFPCLRRGSPLRRAPGDRAPRRFSSRALALFAPARAVDHRGRRVRDSGTARRRSRTSTRTPIAFRTSRGGHRRSYDDDNDAAARYFREFASVRGARCTGCEPPPEIARSRARSTTTAGRRSTRTRSCKAGSVSGRGAICRERARRFGERGRRLAGVAAPRAIADGDRVGATRHPASPRHRGRARHGSSSSESCVCPCWSRCGDEAGVRPAHRRETRAPSARRRRSARARAARTPTSTTRRQPPLHDITGLGTTAVSTRVRRLI